MRKRFDPSFSMWMPMGQAPSASQLDSLEDLRMTCDPTKLFT